MMYVPVPYINCTNFTDSEFRQLPLARGVTAAICLLLCIITLLLIIITKTYKSTLQRLFLYLTLSTVAYLAVLALHIEHYFNFKSPNIMLCKAIGFLDEYTGSVQLLYTLEITLLLFYKVSDKLYHIRERLHCRKPQSCRRLCKQAILFFIPWTVPILFDVIPFFNIPYSETGPWCGIRTLNDNCSEIRSGLWEQLGIWYIPFGLVGVISLGFIIFMTIVLSIWICKFESQRIRGLKTILAETLLLMGFLVAYCILCAIELTGRIIATKKNIFGVWMMYAISTPLSAVIIPIAFLIYLGKGAIKKVIQRCRKKQLSEFGEPAIASGAPPSIAVTVPSYTDARHLLGTNDPLLQSHQQRTINKSEDENETCCVMYIVQCSFVTKSHEQTHGHY